LFPEGHLVSGVRATPAFSLGNKHCSLCEANEWYFVTKTKIADEISDVNVFRNMEIEAWRKSPDKSQTLFANS
jgi:hypothetical protein